MKLQRIFDSFAAAVCVLGLVFACNSTESPPSPQTIAAGSTTGDDSGVGGNSVSSTGGKTGALKDGGDDDDDTSSTGGNGVAPGDDDDDTVGTDDDDDTSSTGGGGTGGTGFGYAGEEYNPDQGGASTSDPGQHTEDPGTGGGNTEDPGTGGGNTEDPGTGGTGDPGTGGTGDPGTGGSTADPPDECIITEIMEVNVIVFGDASPSGADSEGSMYIKGDATFSGYGIASKNEQDCDSWSLVVGGDLNGSGNAGTGKVWVGGEYNASVNFTNCGVSQVQPGPVDFDALEEKMVGITLALAEYPVNGTVDEGMGGKLTFQGTDKTMNVFSVTAEQIELCTEIVIDVPISSTVVINVSGEDVIFSGKGFRLPDGASCRGGDTDFCGHIVWNMPEAETLSVSGIGIQGSVYAPFAVFSGNGGNIDGQLVCKELTGGIEYHPYFFDGCIELPEEMMPG